MFENEEIIYQNKNGIEYIQFKKLLDFGIKNAYTLKGEGINFRTNSVEVKSSYQKIFKALDLDIDTLLKPVQKHTGNVKCVNELLPIKELENTDGLITNQKNISLVTTNADCILLMFYDPVKRVIANSHSGWRGTFQKIGQETVRKMIENYGCKPEDIMCFISPSIRKCHFEVEDDVKKECEKIFGYTKRTSEFIKSGKIKGGNQKYFIDTVLINEIMLEELGIKKENIIDSGICSVCNSDKISSYRAEGKDYKLATAIISL